MKKTIVLAAVLMLGGLAFLLIAALPFESLKVLLGWSVSDGDFETLTTQNMVVFHGLFAAVGFLSGAGGLALWVHPALIKEAIGLWRALLLDLRVLSKHLRFADEFKGFDWLLGVLILVGVAVRLANLMRPMFHDEAYTYFAFASGSLHTALSDYHLPNNHIFHTLLVFVSTRLLGSAPWVVRLPACLAGILIIPAAYALARRFYNRTSALLAAALVALAPNFIEYSVNARGYTLVAFFTLLSVILADALRLQQNRAAWALLAIINALGFFTVPVMMFPFGMVFIWLALSAWFEPAASLAARLAFWRWWFFAGLLTVLLTLVFYLPVLIYSGPAKLFQNEFVRALPAGTYLEALQVRFQEVWFEWTNPLMGWCVLIPLALLGFSLVFHRKLARPRVALPWAALLWIIILLVVRRPNPWPKVMFFLAPLVAIWVAAGFIGFLRLVRSGRGQPVLERYLVNASVILSVAYAVFIAPQIPQRWQTLGDAEKAVLYLRPLIQPNDVLIVSPPDDAPLWYYSMWHQVPRFFFRPDVETHARLFVVTTEGWHQTVASVLKERGPEIDPPDPAAAQLLVRFNKLSIYRIP